MNLKVNNPNGCLSPEELRDRATPGDPSFQVRFDESTGIYRDCSACIGYGEFPRTDGPKGCPVCKAESDAAFAEFEKGNPPLTFSTDDPAQIEV